MTEDDTFNELRYIVHQLSPGTKIWVDPVTGYRVRISWPDKITHYYENDKLIAIENKDGKKIYI